MNPALAAITIPPVTSLLPHRGPMLLVDEVLEYNDRELTATYHVPPDAFWVAGHFPEPDGPRMPAVLMVEAAAQAAGCHVKLAVRPAARKGLLVSIENTRIRESILPGQTLEIKVTWTGGRQGLNCYSARINRDGVLVASTKIKFIVAG